MYKRKRKGTEFLLGLFLFQQEYGLCVLRGNQHQGVPGLSRPKLPRSATGSKLPHWRLWGSLGRT